MRAHALALFAYAAVLCAAAGVGAFVLIRYVVGPIVWAGWW